MTKKIIFTQLFFKPSTQKSKDFLILFGQGVVVSISSFGVPSIERAEPSNLPIDPPPDVSHRPQSIVPHSRASSHNSQTPTHSPVQAADTTCCGGWTNPGSLPPKLIVEPSRAVTMQSPLQTRYIVSTIRGFATSYISIDDSGTCATYSWGWSSGKLTDSHRRAVRGELLVEFRRIWIIWS